MKILLGINNKKNLELLRRWIASKYEVLIMEQVSDINREFDLLIVDGPIMENLRDNIKSRKESERPIFLPVLLVTNRENVRYITNQLWITVDEIILTPIERVEFAARVEILLRARQLSIETHRLSITDPLTGIYNRRYFFEMAQRDVSKLKRIGLPGTCLMGDIDHFKKINDKFGHGVGDEVLVNVARRIKSCVRDVDIVARYGGEEFVVFLTETDLDGGKKVAERIRTNIAREPISVNGKDIQVTVSIGVSSARGENMDLMKLVEQADIGLYQAKKEGRNRVVVI